MNAQSLIARMREQRERWVEVASGKRVKIRRPAEGEFARFSGPDGKGMSAGLEHVRDFVVGWEGITEADLLGEEVGSSEIVEFSTEVWYELVADRLAWLQPVAKALLQSIADHDLSLAQTSKN